MIRAGGGFGELPLLGGRKAQLAPLGVGNKRGSNAATGADDDSDFAFDADERRAPHVGGGGAGAGAGGASRGPSGAHQSQSQSEKRKAAADIDLDSTPAPLAYAFHPSIHTLRVLNTTASECVHSSPLYTLLTSLPSRMSPFTPYNLEHT